jgi:hypothetical protein
VHAEHTPESALPAPQRLHADDCYGASPSTTVDDSGQKAASKCYNGSMAVAPSTSDDYTDAKAPAAADDAYNAYDAYDDPLDLEQGTDNTSPTYDRDRALSQPKGHPIGLGPAAGIAVAGASTLVATAAIAWRCCRHREGLTAAAEVTADRAQVCADCADCANSPVSTARPVSTVRPVSGCGCLVDWVDCADCAHTAAVHVAVGQCK